MHEGPRTVGWVSVAELGAALQRKPTPLRSIDRTLIDPAGAQTRHSYTAANVDRGSFVPGWAILVDLLLLYVVRSDGFMSKSAGAENIFEPARAEPPKRARPIPTHAHMYPRASIFRAIDGTRSQPLTLMSALCPKRLSFIFSLITFRGSGHHQLNVNSSCSRPFLAPACHFLLRLSILPVL